jgi:hypothetical protein
MDKPKHYARMLLMAIPLVLLAAGCGKNSDSGGAGAGGEGSSDSTAPTVVSTVPADGATGVPLNVVLSATFSEPMHPQNINVDTFLLKSTLDGLSVPGAVGYSGITATFTPNSNLDPNTNYTATITTGAKDPTFNHMVAPKIWTFTTGTTTDNGAPTVSSTSPADGATGVSLNGALSATFSEAMDPLTITGANFTVAGVTGTVGYDSVSFVATFTPSSSLASNTAYTATIVGGGSGVKDLAGNALAANKVWTFTTGTNSDATPPTVSSVNPEDTVSNVCLRHTVNATFSEAMDPLTITGANFTVAGATGAVSYDAARFVATFTPDFDLAGNTNYTATVTTGVKDLAGNAMAANKVWTFRTGTAACLTGPSLGSAQNFAVIAAATITNAAFATAITGDMGLSPGSSITGFPPGTVTGATSTGDASSIAGLARADAGSAYQAAKTLGESPESPERAGNLGGNVLHAGVYHSTSSLSIGGAPLTLDAQGDANAVWIISMNSTLTTTSGGDVILAGGAQAKNVYWRVGSSATLGADIFKGTIMADTSITLGTAAINVQGRLLAGVVTTSGAVSFNDGAHTVVRPAP